MKKPLFLAALFACLAFWPSDGRTEAVSVQALSAQAAADEADGHPYLALYRLEKALQASPSDVNLWRASARLLQSTGHPALARKRWQGVAQLAPGDEEADQALREAGAPPALPEAVDKVQPGPEAGLGLWVSGASREQVRAINAYNRRAPQAQKVRYLFVHSGQWILDRDRTRWSLDLDPARIAADELGGDAAVQLWIEGSGQGADTVDPVAWERLAAGLAAAVAADHRFAGVHLSPAWGGAALYPLYAALRRRLAVPLSVAVGAADPDVFNYADFVVLRPAPAGKDPAAYPGRVRDLATLFLASAQAAGGKAMVGLDARQAPAAGAAYAAARRAVCQSLPREGGAFLGVAVWGLVADDEGTVPDLDPGVWKQMELPLERP